MTILIIYLVGYITWTSQELLYELCENKNYTKRDIYSILLISILWPILVILTILQLIKEL